MPILPSVKTSVYLQFRGVENGRVVYRDERTWLKIYTRPNGTEYVNLSSKRTTGTGSTRRFNVTRDADGRALVVIHP